MAFLRKSPGRYSGFTLFRAGLPDDTVSDMAPLQENRNFHPISWRCAAQKQQEPHHVGCDFIPCELGDHFSHVVCQRPEVAGFV